MSQKTLTISQEFRTGSLDLSTSGITIPTKPLDPFLPLPSHPHNAPKRNNKEHDLQQNYAESIEIHGSHEKLRAAISLLATKVLHSSSLLRVSVQLFLRSSSSAIEVLIGIEGAGLDNGFIESLRSIARKCVKFMKCYRGGLYKSSKPHHQHPVDDFIINVLLPAIVTHHSLALFDSFPTLYRDLSKAWDEIRYIPPLKLQPLIKHIDTKLINTMNDEATHEQKERTLGTVMMKCVDLLEDKDSIRKIEGNWSKCLPLMSGLRGDKDPNLKAILSYLPGEQTLLTHITSTFFPNSFGGFDILGIEHDLCPITHTALKLGRFVVAAQIISKSVIDIAYEANDFDVVIVADRRELEGNHR
ncbi:hypothetical protein M422DRAFT_41636 [Sphaerobolus stellatus SS14]|nr:hypothetical protein M422DRAFT_41636 [Sphaerobolus stellatus SS14]